jgi:hypothetical protein
MFDMSQKGNAWVITLSLVSLLAVGAAAYFYTQNKSLQKEPVATSAITSTLAPAALKTPISSSLPSGSPSSKATVVYEAEGSFTAAEKIELKKKVIDPLLDYYSTESDQILLTLTISKNDKASKDQYPYQGQAIFQGGGNMGFLIMKVGTGVDWWYPECMGGCNLSAAYKLKYPEIASKVQ